MLVYWRVDDSKQCISMVEVGGSPNRHSQSNSVKHQAGRPHRELHFFFRIFSITPSRRLSGEFFWADVLDSSKNGPLLLGGGDIMIYSWYTPLKIHILNLSKWRWMVQTIFRFQVGDFWVSLPGTTCGVGLQHCLGHVCQHSRGQKRLWAFKGVSYLWLVGPYLRLPGCSLRLKVLPGWILIWDSQP